MTIFWSMSFNRELREKQFTLTFLQRRVGNPLRTARSTGFSFKQPRSPATRPNPIGTQNPFKRKTYLRIS